MAGDIYKLLVIGLIFHLVFCYSVFDCYFTSPVVHGMQSFNAGHATAKRVVLIVGDGLRADLLFQKNGFSMLEGPDIVAPYLRSIVQTRGAFGVSHTRVPTESRPGHVALCAGLWEDPSAVLKGWKTNPVDFDSIFNRSSKTFSFGSPDILPMFSRGAVEGRVETWTYDAAEEDFTKDATALDLWVLDKLKTLLHNATTNPALDSNLRSDKVIFFLHLLGLDTTGHSYRPFSQEYMNNIIVVDNIVRETEELLRNFYEDEETSFVFTADHGMSVIGNHGDGHPDNTRTPLVVWGKGVRGPLQDSNPSSHDEYSTTWDLNHLLRRDVEQADITPLIASLLGIDWPVNSVGILPDVDASQPGYLLPTAGLQKVIHAALTNAKVIMEHYRVKQALKSAHTLFYRPYKPLDVLSSGMFPGHLAIEEIEGYIAREQWHTAQEKALNLIKTGLDGLHYLQVYDRTLIRAIVAASYAGWAAYASLFVFQGRQEKPARQSRLVDGIAAAALAGFGTLFIVEKAPWTYFLYVAFPTYFWHQFLSYSPAVYRFSFSWQLMPKIGMVIAALLAMVLGYTHRTVWSLGLLMMAILWPLTWPRHRLKSEPGIAAIWATSCLVTSVFPLLDVNKSENLTAIVSGGAAILLVALASVCTLKLARASLALYSLQMLLVAVAIVVTASSVNNLQAKKGLPFVNQVTAWAVLCLASTLPLVSRVKHVEVPSKLLMYFLSFGPCFVILSISIEGLFYAAFSFTIASWIYVERYLCTGSFRVSAKSGDYAFRTEHLRIVLFFLFFVQVGFFGTGNVASISSFYLSPVYRLIPIFEPFSMAVLLIFKIVAPYVLLSAAFAALNHFLGLPPFSLFLVALMLTDVMTLTFFFNVTDTGSWLEIGQTISFFCITSLLLVWSWLLCALGEYLMADVTI